MGVKKIFAGMVESWPAKVLSLALAIVLFVFHRMSTLDTRTFYSPIVFQNFSALSPASPYPGMIKVNLKGEESELSSILENDVEVFVDMGKIGSPGEYSVPVQWRKKGTAQSVDPLQITVEPAEITFLLDRKISKYVQLIAHITGQPEAGYNITSHSLNPAQVIIEGPMALIGSIYELYTEPVDLSGRRRDFTITAAILNDDPLITIRGDGTTNFTGILSEIIPVRNIPNVPVTITGLAEGLSGTPETRYFTVNLEGNSQNTVERFTPPPGFLRVNCSGISDPGVYTLRVMTGTSEGIRFRVEPQEVRVRIILDGE